MIPVGVKTIQLAVSSSVVFCMLDVNLCALALAQHCIAVLRLLSTDVFWLSLKAVRLVTTMHEVSLWIPNLARALCVTCLLYVQPAVHAVHVHDLANLNSNLRFCNSLLHILLVCCGIAMVTTKVGQLSPAAL